MSVLNAGQRQVIRADTGIDKILIDRVCDAYDCLLKDDVDGYKFNMIQAFAQQGIDPPIRKEDRPTAMDKIKTICIKAISDEWRCSFRSARLRLERRLQS